MRSDPFSEAEIAVLRDMLDTLEHLDEATGGWTTKVDARQTGFSLHVRFDKRVDIGTTLHMSGCFEQGTAKLMQIVSRVVGQIDAAANEVVA